MFSIIFDKFFVFFFLFLFSFVVASDDLKDDNIDRGSRSDKGGLWFGPRLGKRSPEFDGNDRVTVLNLLKAAEAVKYYFDQMQNYDSPTEDEILAYAKAKKKVIFTPRPGRALNEQKKVIFRPILGRSLEDEKRYESVDFTPRLGRRLSDDMPATPSDYDTYRPDPEQMDSRSKYSPRLGRTMNFSPRLGRDMNFSPRLGRDMNFSPRLGRDMNFSPRLGRELDFGFVFTQLSRLSLGHVLVAGNEEEFRSLAKNFVPQKLADQLVNLVSQAQVTEAANFEEAEYDREYANPNEYQSSEGDKEQEYEDGNQASLRSVHPQPEAAPAPVPENNPQPNQMRVNLDELVEKVRAKLLEGLKMNWSSAGNMAATPGPETTEIPTEQENKGPGSTEYNEPPGTPANSPQPKSYVNKKSKPLMVRQPLKSSRSKKTGEVIESHDLYEKVKLTKHKSKQKDSYEEYIMKVPKQEANVYESEEHAEPNAQKAIKNDKFDTKQRQNKRPSARTRMTSNYYMNNRNTDHNYNSENNNNYLNTNFNDNINNMNRKPSNKRIKQIQPTQNHKKKKHDYNDMDGNRNKQQATTEKQSSTTAVEYVDDDYSTVVITSEHIPKAATEFIGTDWHDDPPNENQNAPEPEPSYPKKRIPKKIATNMPIRQRYTISTPSFFNKLPRIAEKYNFDEPIPERDQEEETLKPMVLQPAHINGKVAV